MVKGRLSMADGQWSNASYEWSMVNGRQRMCNVGYFKLNPLCTTLCKDTGAVGRRTLVRGNRRADGGQTD